MAKKDFSNNPAMNFLSAGKVDNAEETEVKAPAEEKQEIKAENQKLVVEVPKKAETKSKQIHLLVKPSTYKKLKKLAKDSGRSVNDFLNCVIEQL